MGVAPKRERPSFHRQSLNRDDPNYPVLHSNHLAYQRASGARCQARLDAGESGSAGSALLVIARDDRFVISACCSGLRAQLSTAPESAPRAVLHISTPIDRRRMLGFPEGTLSY